jgi:hypothetical protein
VPEALFLGLVTHPATRFPDSSADGGLARRTAHLLTANGQGAIVRIWNTDSYTPALLTIDRDEISKSIDAELAVEARWRRYIDPRIPGFAMDAFMALRRAYRRRKFLRVADAAVSDTSPGYRMVRRLINIELAHLGLMRAAVETGCPWTLILEDDASCGDPQAFVDGFMAFADSCRDSDQPAYVNVSRSFDQGRLRIGSLLTPRGTWGGSSAVTAQILSSSRPATNTVCAVLYRTSFLDRLLVVLDTIPLSPVIPIDWKLNAALLQMHESGALGDGDCWFLEPAPIVQRSMQGPAGVS